MATVDFNSSNIELEIRIAIEKERYELMQKNLARIEKYRNVSLIWAEKWKELSHMNDNLSLLEMHKILLKYAGQYLPKEP